ncbi:MAG TPA: hypothetical protein VEL07_03950 [Planctomycetota bacterium]|nr:hypothetical protein [Planctomycetota bacterium]
MEWWRTVSLGVGMTVGATACDLCAVTSAVEARGDTMSPPLAMLNAAANATTGAAEASASAARPILEPQPQPRRPLGVTVGLLAAYEARRTTLRGDERLGDDDFTDTARLDLMLGWRFADRWGARAYVPYLDREYELDDLAGTERGVGDTMLELYAMPLRQVAPGRMALVTVFAGAFLPTGDDDLLTAHETEAIAPSGGHAHGTGAVVTTPAAHGHHLALGSGSIDPLIGASTYLRRGRLFLTGHALYRFAQENDDGYHRGDECMWGGGPGVVVIDAADGMLGAQLNVSGTWHDPDEHDGATVAHSGSTEVFVGPALTGSWRDLISAELGLDLPVFHQVDGTQLVADWRLHAGVSASF